MSFANFRKEAFANKSHAFLTCLFFALLAIAIISSVLIVKYVQGISSQVNQDMEAFMNEKAIDPGKTADDFPARPAHCPKALVGIYIERVLDADIKQSFWDYECTIWFRWKPSEVDFLGRNKFMPDGQIPFKIIDGSIASTEVTEHFKIPQDSSEYIQYFVRAKSSKFFDVCLYPVDKHDLILQVEHKWLERNQLLLVPDTTESKISSRVSVCGYIKSPEPIIIEKPHRYRSSKGNPNFTDGHRLVFSQARMAMHISRGGVSNVFKLFLVLYIAVVVAFVSFFASDPSRYAVGALFTTAGANFILMSKLPALQVYSFAEILYAMCQVVILLMIVFLAILPRITAVDNRPDFFEKKMHLAIHSSLLLFTIVLNILLIKVALQ